MIGMKCFTSCLSATQVIHANAGAICRGRLGGAGELSSGFRLSPFHDTPSQAGPSKTVAWERAPRWLPVLKCLSLDVTCNITSHFNCKVAKQYSCHMGSGNCVWVISSSVYCYMTDLTQTRLPGSSLTNIAHSKKKKKKGKLYHYNF